MDRYKKTCKTAGFFMPFIYILRVVQKYFWGLQQQKLP